MLTLSFPSTFRRPSTNLRITSSADLHLPWSISTLPNLDNMPKVLKWLVPYEISVLDSSSRRRSSSICLYRYYIESIIICPISSGSVDLGRYGCTDAKYFYSTYSSF